MSRAIPIGIPRTYEHYLLRELDWQLYRAELYWAAYTSSDNDPDSIYSYVKGWDDIETLTLMEVRESTYQFKDTTGSL